MLEMLESRWMLQALDTFRQLGAVNGHCGWRRSVRMGNCRPSLALGVWASPVMVTSWAGYHPPHPVCQCT